MFTPSTLTRLAAGLAAACSLAACGGTVDFTLEKDLDVDATVDGGAVVAAADLAAEAGGAWRHRSKISSVSIDVAEATVTAVHAPPNTATAVSGSVWLLPEGAADPGAAGSVKVGDFTDEPVLPGNTFGLTLSPALNAFVERTFDGTGRFAVYARGTGAGGEVVACRLHVVLGGRVKWRAF